MVFSRVRRWCLSTLAVLGSAALFAAPAAAQGGVITGKVTDAATGRAIENAQIQAAAAGGLSYGAISGADGSFRVVNVRDGAYTVTVRALGYVPRTFPGIRPGASVAAALTERPTQLNETVVTASRSRPEKALDAPAQISVISSERIAERPALTVTDHLRGTPGVDINRGGVVQANIVARGFNSAFSGSMLMLQDYRFAGVPSLRVNVPFLFTGTMDDIDRMEVLLGPASALYGPNSAAGVLHMITKSPFTSQGTTVSVDGGERSIIRTSLRHATKLSDKVAFKLSGEYMQGRDFEYNDLAEPRTFGTTANLPASRRGATNQRDFDLQKATGEARLDIRPSANSEAITTVGYTKVGSGIEMTGANGSSQIKNWTYLSLQQRLRYKRLFGQVFYNNSDAGNPDAASDQGTFLLRSGQPIVDQSRVAAAQLQHGFDLGKKQTFTYGVDYIWTNPRTGGTINGVNEDVDNMTEYGGYIQSSTKPVKQLELLAAARVDRNNVIAGNLFSPRAALIIKPTETQNIRFTYNRSFNTPANFSFFLDLIQSPNAGGSGFDVKARGNPPKEGWQFNRSCASSSAFGGFCMKSVYANGGNFTGTSAAAAFPGAINALSSRLVPGVAQALSANFPAAVAQQLAAGAVQFLGTRTPTNAELATRVSYLTTATVPVTAEALTDIAPLRAAFNSTYEVGYKGIVGNRFRYDVSYWAQERGDVGVSAALNTPNVFFGNPQQLGGYLGAQLGGYFAQALQGVVPAAQIPATAAALASGIASALTPSVAAVPLGVVTWANGVTAPNAVYATYQSATGKLWVRGLDLAADIVATDRLTFDVSYSWQNKNVFPQFNGGNAQPLMSNTPINRGSMGARYRNESNGFGSELRMRYNDAYPVNSGVYANNFAFPIAAGQAGAATNASGGANRCAPAPAGTFCYETIPSAFIFDAQLSKKFDLGDQQLTWSVNAQNIFDNRVRTFPGAPEIGRLVMTRLSYAF